MLTSWDSSPSATTRSNFLEAQLRQAVGDDALRAQQRHQAQELGLDQGPLARPPQPQVANEAKAESTTPLAMPGKNILTV
ncbi:MAG: hypothetical protein MUF51_02605 [Vicinamibacteria bacterium]|jgi:hypothetical protein|nr:hypothetical protein [Vicinamibacteria bacterium]